MRRNSTCAALRQRYNMLVSSPLLNILEKKKGVWRQTLLQEKKKKRKPVTRIYIYEATRVLFFIQMDSPAWHSRIKPDKHTTHNTLSQTQRRRSGVKKKKKRRERWKKKTWIPAVVCVLEQVNSLYSRIAITSTLQQGCSWLELNAVWPDQTRGLFFSLFVKMQIWAASHCKNSSRLLSTFPIFGSRRKKKPPKLWQYLQNMFWILKFGWKKRACFLLFFSNNDNFAFHFSS